MKTGEGFKIDAKRQKEETTMDRLSDLPEHILQKILCFLSQHEAARTSALSKRWRALWITRPKVDFSEASFKGKKQEFLSLVNNTLQRYHHQNLSLDEFHLSLYDDESFWLLEEWIPRLAQLGVKGFYLSIASKKFKILIKQKYRPLPWVVFEAGFCLQELRVTRFKLVHRHHQKKIIALKNLKRLHLDQVRIEDKEIFHNIISSCPSIETLKLYHCEGLSRVKLDNNLSNLKHFTHEGTFKPCNIEIHESPSLERIGISFNRIRFQPQEFRNLNKLDLKYVGLSVPHQVSSCKFPCLKYLTLLSCYGFEDSHLFVDAPKIVEFAYRGNFIPSISFAPTSSPWNSVVHVYWPERSNDVSLWLLKLSELLQSLSQSSMYLHIYECSHCPHFEAEQQPVEVESLKLSGDLSSFPSLLNALFRICRPNTLGNNFNSKREIPKLLYKILMRRESGSDWVRDLEDVRMEMSDENGVKWDEVTVLEDSMAKRKTGEYLYRQVRFRLKWREA